MGLDTTRDAEINSVKSHVRFGKIGSDVVVYVNQASHAPLKRVYMGILTQYSKLKSAVSVAQDGVRYLVAVLDCAPSWNGLTPGGLLDAVLTYFTRRFGGGVTWRTPQDGRIYLRCECGTSHATVNTVLSRLRLAFELAVAQGWLPGDPMPQFCGPRVPNRSRLYDGYGAPTVSGPLPQRQSHLYYEIHGKMHTPRRLIDNDGLPDELRQAAIRAQWPLRSHCGLELLICGGPRVDEVADLTCAGFNFLDLENALGLRNKGNGNEIVKATFLSERARKLLTSYFLGERRQFDPHEKDFEHWLKGKEATIPLYLRFLDHESIARHKIPVFLSQSGKGYQTKSFQRHEFYKLRLLEHGLAISAHHVRIWYVNQFLSRLTADKDLPVSIIISRVLAFTREMGWASYKSMRPYDIRGDVMAIMDDFYKESQGQTGDNVITHEIPRVDEELDYERACLELFASD